MAKRENVVAEKMCIHRNVNACAKCEEAAQAKTAAKSKPPVTKTDPNVIQARLTAAGARALTDEVKRDTEALWLKIGRLYEEDAHVLLDYPSWDAYLEAEFNIKRARAYQLVAAFRVNEIVQSTSGGLPEQTTLTERTARIAAPLISRPETLVAAIEEATDGKIVRASTLAKVVARETGKPQPPKQICLDEDRLRAVAAGDADAILWLRERLAR